MQFIKKYVLSLVAFALACIGFVAGFIVHSLHIGYSAGANAVENLSSH